MEYRLTSDQIFSACSINGYLLLRTAYGRQIAINCKVAKLARKRSFADRTIFVSYKSCNFHTYISTKVSFY